MAGGFRLAEWTVPLRLTTLERNGHTARLEPKVCTCWCLWPTTTENLYPKSSFIRVVWADTFVTDEVLTRCISELRKALNDDPKQPRFIETISKVVTGSFPQWSW